MNSRPLAIIAGSGALPRLLAAAVAQSGRAYRVVHFKGLTLDWVAEQPVIAAEFERLGEMFAALKRAGLTSAVFAGGMIRPALDVTRLDDQSTRLAQALHGGDDSTLRAAAALFAAQGIAIVAAHQVLPDLMAGDGVLGAHVPSKGDLADITRAAALAAALGTVDAGQGAVVAQGLCLGLETVQGTDAMLRFVAQTAAPFRPVPDGPRGVLFKGPKPGQDLRFDLPTIGPDTVNNAARAGLAGIALGAGQSLILERAATVAAADAAGLFLFGHAAL